MSMPLGRRLRSLWLCGMAFTVWEPVEWALVVEVAPAREESAFLAEREEVQEESAWGRRERRSRSPPDIARYKGRHSVRAATREEGRAMSSDRAPLDSKGLTCAPEIAIGLHSCSRFHPDVVGCADHAPDGGNHQTDQRQS